MHAAIGAPDSLAYTTIATMLRKMEGRGLVWALDDPSQAARFDSVLVMRGGRIVEQGSYAELENKGELIAAE